jgi:hypothetical protein
MEWVTSFLAGLGLFINSIFGITPAVVSLSPATVPIASSSSLGVNAQAINKKESSVAIAKTMLSYADSGTLSDTGNGISTYLSSKYKFSFSYPTNWRVGDSNIGNGAFQLFNYPLAQEVQSEGFVKGHSKIEAVLINNLPGQIFTPQDYFSPNEITYEKTIAGQKAYYGDSDGVSSYLITVPSTTPIEYLGISEYGDTSDSSTIEKIVASLKWH